MTVAEAPARPRAATTPRLRWWQWSLLVYAGSRLVSTGLVLLVIRHARPASRIGVGAHLLDALTSWDGQWYRLIALQGYPTHLPRDLSGVAENAWAFLPVYPELVRALSFGVAAAWPATAVAVSITAGAVATVLLAALVRPHVGDRGAVVTAATFALSPVAFLLEYAYAEALALALLFAVLLLMDRRRYLAAAPVALVLGFTRPGLQALLLLVVLLQVVRVWRARRHGSRTPPREWLGAGVLAVAVLVGGLAWPAIAAAVTGMPQAYLDTELEWRRDWAGSAVLRPGASWLSAADFWFGALGPVVLAVLAAAVVALLVVPAARRAGATVRLWTACWLLYLIAVVFPQSSIFRLLMPAAPIGSVLAAARTRTVVAVLGMSVALQAVWLYCVDGYASHFWNVP